jgi:hypothetical protein
MEYSNVVGRVYTQTGTAFPRLSTAEGISSLSRAGQPNFAQVLAETTKGLGFRAPRAEVPLQNLLERKLEQVVTGWERSGAKMIKLVEKLPAEVRPLMETQIVVNKLALDVQLITRAGETLGSTLRQVQQLGSR